MSGTTVSFDGGWPAAPFEVAEPTVSRIPVVAHVPHASTLIPADVRAEFVVDDAELRAEIVRFTDWHTDDLFAWLTNLGVTLFVGRLSRFVFDPERFLDERVEPAAALGLGVVYTRGTQGQRLREKAEELRDERVEHLYRPYHAELDELIETMLARFGTCLVLDCHSFPSQPLPVELDQTPHRPDVCIGTDATHTPEAVADALGTAFREVGWSVKRDSPYAGAFVPGGSYQRETRVRSVMIEVNRRLYLDEGSGEPSRGYDRTRATLERAIIASGVLGSGS